MFKIMVLVLIVNVCGLYLVNKRRKEVESAVKNLSDIKSMLWDIEFTVDLHK